MQNRQEEPYIIEFPQHGDSRGHLVVVEGEKDIPFAIQRIFYIYGSDRTIVRGKHANRNSRFILVNVCGQCKVRTADGRGGERVFELNHPHMGLYLPTMVWKDMYDFSQDSILLCLASENYDEGEYIRDWEQFCAQVREREA